MIHLLKQLHDLSYLVLCTYWFTELKLGILGLTENDNLIYFKKSFCNLLFWTQCSL